MRIKRYLLVSISCVLLLVVTLIFISYAYKPTTILGNDNSRNNLFKVKGVSIEYSGRSNILNSNSDYFLPGSTLNKTFVVRNTGDKDVLFDISLENVVNTFERKEDIVYELKVNNDIISSGTFPNEDIVLANETLLKNEEKMYTLIIKYSMSLENEIVDNGKTINANVILH